LFFLINGAIGVYLCSSVDHKQEPHDIPPDEKSQPNCDASTRNRPLLRTICDGHGAEELLFYMDLMDKDPLRRCAIPSRTTKFSCPLL
jgi:hypothetical protein